MGQSSHEAPGDAEAHAHLGAARAPEGATFETIRIGGRHQRPPIFLLAFVAVIAGMVAVGLGSRSPAGGPAALGSPLALEAARTTPQPSNSTRDGLVEPSSPLFSRDMAPVVTNGSGPIVVQARRHPETMYVHGDVYVDQVTWVFVSLEDQSGRIAGWASVSVPGAAGPGVGGGPTLRFDVELALPPELSGGSLWIQVNAHDSAGELIAATRLEVDRDGRGVAAVAPGFRPGVFFPLLDASWEDVP